MDIGKPYAFSGRYGMYRNRIVSDVWLGSPEEGNETAVRIRALWDTGCSHSIVSKRVVDFLSLPMVGEKRYRSPFGGERTCEMTCVKVSVVLGAISLLLTTMSNWCYRSAIRHSVCRPTTRRSLRR